MLDKDAFDAEFGTAEHGETDSADDSEEEGDGDISMAEDEETASASGGAATKRKKGGANAGDLRKKLLKQAGEKDRERESTMTPGLEDERRSVDGTATPNVEDRGESPVPVPDDPEAVAQAVEADKAGAEASEQTWVDVNTNGDGGDIDDAMTGDVNGNANGSGSGQGDAELDPRKTMRPGSFYANANYYVLVRLIEVSSATLEA
jgi:paired amphipathic helix protein Sin3a